MNPGIHCINSESENPFFNLALEEILLKKRPGDYFILSVNRPSVIIGKHQIAHRESDTRYVNENNIPVIRRISGGGTVYHDHGNLNFSFIVNSEEGKQIDFRKYTNPVADFLISRGVEARFEGRNDLRVNGFKISGNAEHVFRKRVLHHGTLLFDASVDALGGSLRKDLSCYISKSVDSVPSMVTNICGIINGISDINSLRTEMMNYFLDNLPLAQAYNLSENEKHEAQLAATDKYMTWEWNYAYGPEYHFARNFNYSGNKVSCRLYVKDGIIRECILDGSQQLKSLQDNLKGTRHMPDALKDVIGIDDLDVYNFF
jgi:lipoate-protein ligase A